MDFPEKFRVGYRSYHIEDWSPRAAYSSGRYGEASHVEGVIRVDTSHGPVQSAETLLHEILHAVSATNHANLFGHGEEAAVTGLSAGLTQVMRDNPAVRDWLAWAWTQED